MNKKIVFTFGFAAALLLAGGQVFAATTSPAPAGGTGNTTAPLSVQQQFQQNNQKMQLYMPKLSQGALPADEQKDMYKIMTTPPPQTLQGAPQNASGSRPIAGQPYFAESWRVAAWAGLMSIITTILLWVTLLLMIFALTHWLKKHKHG